MVHPPAFSSGDRDGNGGSGDSNVSAPDEGPAHGVAHGSGAGGSGGEGWHSGGSAAEPGSPARSQQQAGHALPTHAASSRVAHCARSLLLTTCIASLRAMARDLKYLFTEAAAS